MDKSLLAYIFANQSFNLSAWLLINSVITQSAVNAVETVLMFFLYILAMQQLSTYSQIIAETTLFFKGALDIR